MPVISIIVHFEAHFVLYLIILYRYMVLEDYMLLLEPDFLGPDSDLARDKLLEVTDFVLRAILAAQHTST